MGTKVRRTSFDKGENNIIVYDNSIGFVYSYFPIFPYQELDIFLITESATSFPNVNCGAGQFYLCCDPHNNRVILNQCRYNQYPDCCSCCCWQG